MTKVLVTGATGFTGSHLTRRLLDEGYEVRILVRSTSNTARSELSGTEVIIGDVTDAESVKRAVEGVDTVYHIAALFRKAGLPDDAYWDVNYKGTLNLLKASRDNGVQRFIHCSTVGVLGHIENPPADEDAPYNPGDVYQVTKCEAEKEALKANQELGLPATVVRPAGIYGPGDTRWLKLFRAVKKRRFAMLGDGETFIHMVYISDLVEAFLLAASGENSVGRVYIAGGERYVTLNELVRLIASAVRVPEPHMHIPLWPVYGMSALCEGLCRKIGVEPPLYRRRVDFFVKDRAFDINRAKMELGYHPEVDLQDGIARTAEWYKEQGLL